MPHLLCLLAALAQAPAAPEPLTLERAIELALSRNERSQIAGAQNDAADGRLEQARAFFFPSLTVSGNFNRRAYEVVRDVGGTQVTVQQYNALNGSAVLGWTLFDARLIPLYRASSADQRATRLDASDARRRLAFEAALAYLVTLGEALVNEAAQRRVELSRQNLADAKARRDAGLASSNDVTRSTLALATAERDAATAAGTAKLARLNLGFLLDLPTEQVVGLTPPATLVDAVSAQSESLDRATLEQVGRSRLDVQALGERAAQADALAHEPILRAVPVVGLTAQGSLTNESGFSGRPWSAYVGLNFTWALFDGGARYGVHDERAANARIAALNARLKERGVIVEVENALVALSSARAYEVQARVALDAARLNAQEVSARYRQGLATAFEQSDATLQQFEAEASMVKGGYGVLQSMLEVRLALGVDPLGREVQP